MSKGPQERRQARDSEIAEAEAAAREQLQQIAGELQGIRVRLGAIHDSLPFSSREDVMLLGEEDKDFSTEVRGVIGCVLTDSIQPAIRDLRAAAEYKPFSKSGKGEPAP